MGKPGPDRLPRILSQTSAERLLAADGWVRTLGGKHVVKMEKPGERAGADPRVHKPPEQGEYGGGEMEARLKDWFGGDRWYCYPDGPGLGVDVCAGFSVNPAGRLVLSGLVLLGDAITADMLRKVPVAALENSVNITREQTVREEVDRLPRLARADGMSPDAFSQVVAEHYKTWARVVPHPAAAMAADAGVKIPTVHSWIREARLRGLLPAARRGKSG